MDKPRIYGNNWVMTMSLRDSYGEELWSLKPNKGDWSAVIHLQQSGKMYLTVMKPGKSSSGKVDQKAICEAMKCLSQMVYEERGVVALIAVVVKDSNAKLFSTVRKAGFRKKVGSAAVKDRKRKTILFEYKPQLQRENKDEVEK